MWCLKSSKIFQTLKVEVIYNFQEILDDSSTVQSGRFIEMLKSWFSQSMLLQEIYLFEVETRYFKEHEVNAST